MGYLTFARNRKDTDYLRMAYMQAASIKTYMSRASVSVIVDQDTNKEVTDLVRNKFDRVVVMSQDLTEQHGMFANELQAFALTPYKETIKLESDLVLTRDISHWIHGFRHHDILMPTGVVNFRNEVTVDDTYRNFFRVNKLPNVYTGIYYFRYSQAASEFFKLVHELFVNWSTHKNSWKNSPDAASTDVVFGIAALIFGTERCTNPALSYPTMVHMKGALNGLPADADWTDHLYSQLDTDKNLIVGFNRQVYPFHYYIKDWQQNYD